MVGGDYSRFLGWLAEVGGGTGGAVGVDLSAPEGREQNIEEVDQAGALIVPGMAVVG